MQIRGRTASHPLLGRSVIVDNQIGTYYLNIVGGIAFIFIVKRIPHRTLYREKTKAELEADRQLKELSSKKLDL